tara:strand:+ start:16362 stop:18065 length:1704 start_codon:yes stop_codon:yes gene_type:complete
MNKFSIKSIVSKALVLPFVMQTPAMAITYDGSEKKDANQYIEQNLLDGLPFTFTIPKAAQLDLSSSQMNRIESDRDAALFEFRHSASDKTGMRLYITNNKPRERSGIIKSLQEKGLIQSGDVVLKFHPEWGFTGGYPTVMAGISHAGFLYEDGGKIYNADMPLNNSFNRDMLNSRRPSQMSSSVWMQEAHFVHVLRPRANKMSESERRNSARWATELVNNMGNYYPSKICFNSNYMVPGYVLNPNFETQLRQTNPNDPYAMASLVTPHSKELAYIAKSDRNIRTWVNPKTMNSTTSKVCMFCSDFAWSISSLRKCDFNGRLGECNPEPMFAPIPILGNGPIASGSYKPGVADLSYIVLSQMGLDARTAGQLVQQAFSPLKPITNMSSGHRTASAGIPSSLYGGVVQYTQALLAGNVDGANQVRAGIMQEMANNGLKIPDNYSPNAFLVNSVLPKNNPHKAYDYVTTIAFLDQRKVDKIKHLAERQGSNTSSSVVDSTPAASIGSARQVPADFPARFGRKLRRCIGTVNWGNGYVAAMGRLGYGDCQDVRQALGSDWEQYVDHNIQNN